MGMYVQSINDGKGRAGTKANMRRMTMDGWRSRGVAEGKIRMYGKTENKKMRREVAVCEY